MDFTFQNQLTGSEIRQGLLLYIFRRMWKIFFVAVFGIAFFFLLTGNLAAGLVAGVIVAGIMLLLLYSVLRRQFSTERVATYNVGDTGMEVVGSDGVHHSFPMGGISMLESAGVLVLCLTGSAFAIVTKGALSGEQLDYLRRVTK